jgi:L-lactate dehydrogenase (cytochrome)
MAVLAHTESLLQIFLSPTGMAGLAHPQGERLLASGAGECNAIYMVSLVLPGHVDVRASELSPVEQVSTNASAPLDEIIGSAIGPEQPLFMQLYVDRNRPKTEALIRKINGLGLKGIFVTVDAAAPGKREADERSRAEVEMVGPSYRLSERVGSETDCDI